VNYAPARSAEAPSSVGALLAASAVARLMGAVDAACDCGNGALVVHRAGSLPLVLPPQPIVAVPLQSMSFLTDHPKRIDVGSATQAR